MKNLSTLLAIGLTAFGVTLFAQNNQSAGQPLQAIHKNALPFFASPSSPANFSAEDQLTKSVNTSQPAHNDVHKPTVHAPHVTSYIELYDSVYLWIWDSNSPYWHTPAYSRYINMVYDGNNDLTSYIAQTYNDTNWVNSGEYTFTNNTRHSETGFLYKAWINSAWVKQDSGSYTYDANNNRTGELYYIWNNPGWIGSVEYFYTFNGNSQQTSYTYKLWSNSAWTNKDSDAYTYSGNNETSEMDYYWDTSAWVLSGEYLYTYNGSNNQISYLYEYWIDSAWVKEDSSAYYYNTNNKQVRALEFDFNSPKWDTVNEYLYTYDVNNNNLSSTYKSWNAGWINGDSIAYFYNIGNLENGGQQFNGKNITAWVIGEDWAYAYDVNNVVQWQAYKYYNAAGTKIISGDSEYYYHTDVLGINDVKGESGEVKVYPNPSNGQFTIRLSVGNTSSSGGSVVEVYNALGEQVLRQTLQSAQGNNTINLNNQPSGVYLYRVITTNRELIGEGKVIVQR